MSSAVSSSFFSFLAVFAFAAVDVGSTRCCRVHCTRRKLCASGRTGTLLCFLFPTLVFGVRGRWNWNLPCHVAIRISLLLSVLSSSFTTRFELQLKQQKHSAGPRMQATRTLLLFTPPLLLQRTKTKSSKPICHVCLLRHKRTQKLGLSLRDVSIVVLLYCCIVLLYCCVVVFSILNNTTGGKYLADEFDSFCQTEWSTQHCGVMLAGKVDLFVVLLFVASCFVVCRLLSLLFCYFIVCCFVVCSHMSPEVAKVIRHNAIIQERTMAAVHDGLDMPVFQLLEVPLF
jgi:hypothetical protein